PLTSSDERGNEVFIHLTNGAFGSGGAVFPSMTLDIRRSRAIRDGRVEERIEITKHGCASVTGDVALSLRCDFADMFEIRGLYKSTARGRRARPLRTDRGFGFAHLGRDQRVRETRMHWEPLPDAVDLAPDGANARWNLQLGQQDGWLLTVVIEPLREDRPLPPLHPVAADPDDVEPAHRARVTAAPGWLREVFATSLQDIDTLRTPVDGGTIIAAGVPWFVAPFGRDSLITSLSLLMVDKRPAADTLAFLSAHQATAADPLTEAEPGKILHELRSGELASAGLIPHTPYYGSVDATPLYVMLAGEYLRWTGDLALLERLTPWLAAAVEWIDRYGDRDGDGFVEYAPGVELGVVHQGWKDSTQAIVHRDGSRAEGPIALVEVQGCVYAAKAALARVYEALGDTSAAAKLRAQAKELRAAFNDAFWMPEEGSYALALDGHKQPVESVASNAGHSLFTGIADEDKAARVAERLMARDMFSGWGIRTLSASSPAYNPMSYHRGSVWPHDNALISAGLRRYGRLDALERVATALFDAAAASPSARLPELMCGFARRGGDPYVSYPVACRPQAWAAAAPFLVLQALLGVSPDAANGRIRVDLPLVPEWMGGLDLEGVAVGRGHAGITFTPATTAGWRGDTRRG
ncbi:MAG TPA: glycogen debranching N-terminal domain-containing protein, partial [Actinomycetota bacterium]|nr:glycogen debranching N-terminal domain-containing protein [Actinomycetota bacterium]